MRRSASLGKPRIKSCKQIQLESQSRAQFLLIFLTSLHQIKKSAPNLRPKIRFRGAIDFFVYALSGRKCTPSIWMNFLSEEFARREAPFRTKNDAIFLETVLPLLLLKIKFKWQIASPQNDSQPWSTICWTTETVNFIELLMSFGGD